MTDDSLFHDDDYNPATMPTSSLSNLTVVWYRRPWFLITLTIVIIVALSVLADIPHPLTRPDDIKSQTASIKEMNVDVKPCVFALEESLRFYHQEVLGSVTSEQLRIIKSYLTNDVNVCSGASGQTDSLVSQVQIVETPAGKHIQDAHTAIDTWAAINAYHVISDIQEHTLFPRQRKPIESLKSDFALLQQSRRQAESEIASASAILKTTLPSLKLPVLQQPPYPTK